MSNMLGKETLTWLDLQLFENQKPFKRIAFQRNKGFKQMRQNIFPI